MFSSDASCNRSGCCVAGLAQDGPVSRCFSDGDVLDGEIHGISNALDVAKRNHERRPRLHTDSKGAMHWLSRGCSRQFKNRKQRHRPSTEQAVGRFESMLQYFDEVTISWIPRSQNSDADGRSRECYVTSEQCSILEAPRCMYECVESSRHQMTCKILDVFK